VSDPGPRPSGYGTPPPVLPPNPGQATLRRLPGGVRLPWALSAVLLLLVGATIATLIGLGTRDLVPPSVLDARASITYATAQGMRRGLDEATDDLVVLAAVLQERDESEWAGLQADFLEAHDRYSVLYVVSPGGDTRYVAGSGRTLPELLPDPLLFEPGLTQPQAAGKVPALLAYAPLERTGLPPLVLVGRYDMAFLLAALEQTAPGVGYVVDQGGGIVAATTGFQAFQPLPGTTLRNGADRAQQGELSGVIVEGDRLVSFAAVVGDTPAGRLDLSVVSVLDSDDLALPANDARRLAVLLGTLTVLLSTLCLFWFYLFVIAPVRRVAAEAERLAFGDRSVPLHVVRYDEIGLLTRALERCRSLLQSAERGR